MDAGVRNVTIRIKLNQPNLPSIYLTQIRIAIDIYLKKLE